MKTWALHQAKNRFSEVLDRAEREGPQAISRRGRPAAVVLSTRDFRALVRPKTTLVEFFARSPLRGLRIDVERDRDRGRDVDL